MLYLIKLEDLSQRYTENMHDSIKQYCLKNRIKITTISGVTTTNNINVGAFLDANGTSFYKASQIACISRMFERKEIKDGDRFLVYDMWFPGIEMIRYMAHFNGIKDIKIYGVAHAGSWTPSDFVAQMKWPKQLERFWIKDYYDKIFVGTQFHKEEMENNLDLHLPQQKIKVTRLPFWEIPKKDIPKKNIVVFAGRPHVEKGFDEFLKMVWKDNRGKYQYVCTGAGLPAKANDLDTFGEHLLYQMIRTRKLKYVYLPTKQDYYNLLMEAKYIYSWAEQENWGYAMLEAVSMGCYPLTKIGKSYTEMFQGTNVQLYSCPNRLYKDFVEGLIPFHSIPIKNLFSGEVFSGTANIIRECME